MKARIPLKLRMVDGVPCPFPSVTLRVQDKYGAFVTLPFRIDTGADFSAIPIKLARREKIAFSESRVGVAVGLVGSTHKFRDQIRVEVAGKEHDWPCDFIEKPAVRKGTESFGELAPVIGRAGFLDEYDFAIKAGLLVITRIGVLRRAWQKWLRLLTELMGMIQSADRPL